MVPAILLPALARQNLRAVRATITRGPRPHGAPPAARTACSMSASGASSHDAPPATRAARAAAAGGGNAHRAPHAASAAVRCLCAGPSLAAALTASAVRGVRQAARIACALWLALAGARTGLAVPYVPQSGAQVVEILPRRADALPPDLLALREQLRAAPKDEALASTLAQRYIALGRSESDPRYFGYAQAALAPWWTAPAPPPQVRLLRATLLQTNHQFAPALQDLDALTSAQPDNAQAWLTRATVQTVRGDYAGATASCAHLPMLAGQLVAFTCLAAARANTGPVAPTARLLQAALARGGDTEPAEIRAWAQTLRAELAARGNDPLADAHFRAALALSPRDGYLLGAYADYLLDQHRAADVLRLLQAHHRVDSLLLRHALALQLVGSPELPAAVAELQARFNEAARRGSSVHQREQARFVLSLLQDAPSALALAQQNWQVQKEAADVRLLLEAALRAHDAAAAREAAAWIARHGMEDVHLAALMRQAGELK
jgi:hypothetical protein